MEIRKKILMRNLSLLIKWLWFGKISILLAINTRKLDLLNHKVKCHKVLLNATHLHFLAEVLLFGLAGLEALL